MNNKEVRSFAATSASLLIGTLSGLMAYVAGDIKIAVIMAALAGYLAYAFFMNALSEPEQVIIRERKHTEPQIYNLKEQ